MEEDKQPVSAVKPKGLSVAAMVCGICSLVIPYLGIISGIVAIILGIVALVKIKKGEADGKGMAIAGLATGSVSLVLVVLIVVFIVVRYLPVFNSSLPQADTQRRNDYAIMASEIVTYQTNNNGQLPAVGDEAFVDRYLSELYDPGTGLSYNVVIRENSGAIYENQHLNAGDVIIEVGSGYNCDGDLTQSLRHYRMLGYLETGTVYCMDN